MPQIKIQQIQTDQLNPYSNNIKQHPPEQIEKIVRSIAEFGFTVPILVDGNFEVIAGHGRLEAAKQMHLKSVPCIVRDDLSAAQVKALRIADNRIADDGAWDEAALMAELAELAELEYDLTLTGWDEADLTAFDEPETEYQERQTIGTAPRMPAIERQTDDEPDGDDLADEPPEQPAPPPAGDKYPLSIVLSSGELKEWKAFKESIDERQDKTAFLKLMRGEV
ncbi:ParB/Srx family N-terminal domain-containing protein [Leptolyngbya ohadii]|uniref:ParB/Srx family N-terminal domain-containing protein n=1 Tax=Leptolyngbya ohadii TaxID=1962290 RepID=UPI000B59BDB6|nr:ParB/Srx family N-terminal domain-containing protein [Leptolyngbya ohadii]